MVKIYGNSKFSAFLHGSYIENGYFDYVCSL